MATLPEALLQKMRDKSKAIKEKQSAQYGPKAPRYDLSGKNAVVAPGGEVMARLFPRWDYMTRWNKVDGKYVPNAKYVEDFPFFVGLAHWYDIVNEKGESVRRKDWCLRTFDADAECPLCDAAAALGDSPDADERKKGKDLEAKEEYLFNAIIKVMGPNKALIFKLTEQGKPDIRIMSLSDTLVSQFNDIVTGGEQGTQETACGDVTHIKEGYTLRFQRPKAKNERWRLDPARIATPVFADKDPVWAGWPSLLHDIPDIVKQELRTFEAIYKDFHGEAPEKAAEEPAKQAPKGAKPAAAVKQSPPPPPDDEFPASAGEQATETPDEAPGAAQEAQDGPDGIDLPPDPETPPLPGGATKVAGRKK